MVKHLAFAVPGDLATPTGGYAYDRRIIAELRDLGWRIDLLDLGEDFPWPGEGTRAAARERLLSLPGGQTIVVDGLALGVLPEVASELAGRNPLLALVHHPLAFEWGLSVEQVDALCRSERAALATVRGVIVTSAATARLVSSDYGVSPSHIIVVKPGNDPAPLAQGGPGDTVRLLSVGAIVPRKGFEVLVSALATLPDLRWRLTIAGDRTRDRDTAARLDAEIERHGIADRVAVLGAISAEQLAQLYMEADAFVLASNFEGYGMAYAEALAHGLPIIGTSSGAIPDTVPAKAGLLVAPGDVPALAQALRQLIGNAELRQYLSNGSRAAAAQLPTWRQSAQTFAHALELLVQRI